MLVEDVPEELPLPLSPAVPEPKEPLPAEPLPAVPVPPEPDELVPLPLPIALPVAEPLVDEPLFEALFKRGWPVELSRQCVAADTLLVADGEEEEDED